MKTIEQKAKAYDEALERAKKLHKDALTLQLEQDIKDYEYIFPELKESEDEKIRNIIIRCLKGNMPDNNYRKECITWLEKQKDCIKLPNSAYTSNRDVIEFADKYSHTIWEKLMDKFKKNENYSIGCNDVSDIVLNAIINTYNWLEKQGEESNDKVEPKFKVGDRITKSYKKSCPVHSSIDDTICEVAEVHDTCYILNTKEGRIQEPFKWQDYYELVEPAWGEEDEHRIKDIIYFLDTAKKHYASTVELDACIDWLKSLKPHNWWKPSDEQMKVLD